MRRFNVYSSLTPLIREGHYSAIAAKVVFLALALHYRPQVKGKSSAPNWNKELRLQINVKHQQVAPVHLKQLNKILVFLGARILRAYQ